MAGLALALAPAIAPGAAAGKASARAKASSAAASRSNEQLELGFHRLYDLDFHGARAEFRSYEQSFPADPLAQAALAASYLYEEFNAKGVLTSRFFLDDDQLLRGVDGSPAQNRNEPFLEANRQARAMAQAWLRRNARDPRGLLALTLADGMKSDYDALIEGKQLASLSLMRQAEREARRLLAEDPSEQDAYVALGASEYIIGCMPSYKRAMLWFGGIHGDRARGMEELQQAAMSGHYLRPFAEILLALACEREHQPGRARALLAQLTAEFPSNPLFARELALLGGAAGD